VSFEFKMPTKDLGLKSIIDTPGVPIGYISSYAIALRRFKIYTKEKKIE
jgi:hypothetical protein